jgi:thiol-disulfide isomerase/thioredoxin/peroxiredoxin
MCYKYYVIASLIAVLLLLAAGCSKVTPPPTDPLYSPTTEPTETSTSVPEKTPPPEPTTKTEPAANAMPDFSVPLVGGSTFTLYENLGKPLFISMFSISDAPGVEGMIHIERLYKDMGDKATFLVINLGGDEASTKAFADENGYTLPFAYTPDIKGPYGEEYSHNPQTLILNATGVLTGYFPGVSDYDNYYAALEKAGQDLPIIENPVQPADAPKEFTDGIMPAFSLPMVGGGDFVFTGKPDKPVLINLFATWCGACWEEMPHIEKLYKEMGSEVDFLIIDIGEDEATARDYIKQVGNTMPFAYSIDGAPFPDYPVQFLPQTFIVDIDGIITAYFPGPSDYKNFRAALEAVIQQ